MDRHEYKPRFIDERLKQYLSVAGAVCLEGPKWSGKTWTCDYHASSSFYLADPDKNFQNRQLASISPKAVLQGATPRLLDEWQEVPSLWDAVRYTVDQRGEPGQFLLTGSATPKHKGILHSGAGRIVRLRMRPMSLAESGASSKLISLKSLCTGSLEPVLTGDVSLERLMSLIVRGGWPGNLSCSESNARILPKAYLQAVLDDDIYRMDGIKRDSGKMRLLLRSLARNESTTATNRTLQKDIASTDKSDVNEETIASYLDIFQRLFLLDNQPAFAASLRSSSRIKQAEKRHFSDPSLAAALLDATPEKLIDNLETASFLFEALAERDLRIYTEAMDGKLYHYQDYNNREIDAIVEYPDGKYLAIEIKLGANQIDSAARSLLSITQRTGLMPSCCIVLCGLSNAAYKREDGVCVVPLTALTA